MMRQRQIAWQRDRLSAECFVLLLLLPPELLCLVKLQFGSSQRLSKLLIDGSQFAVCLRPVSQPSFVEYYDFGGDS